MKDQEIKLLDDLELDNVVGGFLNGMGGGHSRLGKLYYATFGLKYLLGFSPNASGDPRFKRTYYHNLHHNGEMA